MASSLSSKKPCAGVAPAHCLALLFGLLGALVQPWARAGVSVVAAPCAESVGLKAQDEKLSVVLEAMARKLAFALSFDLAAERQVSIDRRLPAPELIRQLLRHENFGMQEQPDPDCDGHARVVKVWVLPQGEPGQVKRVSGAARDPVAALRELNGLPARPNYPPRDPSHHRGRRTGEGEVRKRRRDMTPEERYNDRINRQMKKNYDLD